MSRFYAPGTSKPVVTGKPDKKKPEPVINIMTGQPIVEGQTINHNAPPPLPVNIQTGQPIAPPKDFVPTGKFLDGIQLNQPKMPLFTRDGRAVPAPLQVMPVIKDTEEEKVKLAEKDKIYNALAEQYYKSTATPNPEYLRALADDIYNKR